MNKVRLIDANALDDSFRHAIVKCKQWFEVAAARGEEESKARAEQAYVTFMECSMRLKKQPTVDAVPVRHGEWLRTDAFPHRIYCSVCYKTYVPNDRWQIWVDDELPKNYCPNCGAKMDGADGERRSE